MQFNFCKLRYIQKCRQWWKWQIWRNFVDNFSKVVDITFEWIYCCTEGSQNVGVFGERGKFCKSSDSDEISLRVKTKSFNWLNILSSPERAQRVGEFGENGENGDSGEISPRVLRKSLDWIIVIRGEWLWNSSKFFVVCYCSVFWPWPCTKHNSCLLRTEELTHRNVLWT